MNPIYHYALILISVFVIVSCGENKSETSNESSVGSSSIQDKTMCELLTKEMMSSITGISFNEEMNTLHQIDANTGKYVSQCGYNADGVNMAVLVRRFGDNAFPTEKEKLIGGPKTGNQELDAMMEKAIQTAKTVSGLGDVAYFYDLGGINTLVIIFQKHYQVHITCYGKGFGFDDKTLETSKKVAEEVLKIFNQ